MYDPKFDQVSNMIMGYVEKSENFQELKNIFHAEKGISIDEFPHGSIYGSIAIDSIKEKYTKMLDTYLLENGDKVGELEHKVIKSVFKNGELEKFDEKKTADLLSKKELSDESIDDILNKKNLLEFIGKISDSDSVGGNMKVNLARIISKASQKNDLADQELESLNSYFLKKYGSGASSVLVASFLMSKKSPTESEILSILQTENLKSEVQKLRSKNVDLENESDIKRNLAGLIGYTNVNKSVEVDGIDELKQYFRDEYKTTPSKIVKLSSFMAPPVALANDSDHYGVDSHSLSEDLESTKTIDLSVSPKDLNYEIALKQFYSKHDLVQFATGLSWVKESAQDVLSKNKNNNVPESRAVYLMKELTDKSGKPLLDGYGNTIRVQSDLLVQRTKSMAFGSYSVTINQDYILDDRAISVAALQFLATGKKEAYLRFDRKDQKTSIQYCVKMMRELEINGFPLENIKAPSKNPQDMQIFEQARKMYAAQFSNNAHGISSEGIDKTRKIEMRNSDASDKQTTDFSMPEPSNEGGHAQIQDDEYNYPEAQGSAEVPPDYDGFENNKPKDANSDFADTLNRGASSVRGRSKRPNSRRRSTH